MLVTGANGLLGGHLVRELLSEGHQVRVLVRRQSNVTTLEGLDVERVYGDVRDFEAVSAAAHGCVLMFHAAAVFAYWGYSREEMFATAREGALNAVRAAADAGVHRLVLTSSTAVMGGTNEPVPIDESHPYLQNETLDYLVTKALEERTALAEATRLGVDMVVVNPSMFMGPYDFRPSTSLLSLITYLADPLKITWAGGINLCHAQDVARGHLLLAKQGKPLERYILAGENLEWSAFHTMLSELAGVSPPRLRVGPRVALAGALVMEAAAKLLGKPPLASRAMAKQVGRYFWYRHDKAAALGFTARSARDTVAQTLGWLLHSSHLSARRRRALKPAPEVVAAGT